jgi:DNA-binding SARP family transcriptional activator/tetratricopeptide (TPR) repeat protein
MPDVRFTVLGRVGLSLDGVETPVRGRRERAVLATLLAARREVVSVDRLVDNVWGERPPESAVGSLQVAVSRLRSLIETDRTPKATPRLLVSSGPGYALVAEPRTVDAEVLTLLVDEAHAAMADGDPASAVERCDEALRMWGGAPYGEARDGELVGTEVNRLEDVRLAAREIRVEALLATGRHRLVTGELEQLVGAHPFRERLWELYALALYRSGRQADALSALRRAREVLVEELGIDPSPTLQRLESDVLAQAASLDGPTTARSTGRASAAVTGQHLAPADDVPVAAQPMVGRAEAMAVLTEACARARSGAGQCVVVVGEPGIGKTRLVTELAATAVADGLRVLWGRSHEADVSPAYWPWVPIVRALADAAPPPEVAALLAPTAVAPALDAGSAALRTYDAVSRLLAAAAAERPLLVVLEDIHWADASSLRLLTYAAEWLSGHRVLLVATVRPTAEPSEALETARAALGRLSATRVQLGGLGGEDVRRLIAAVDERGDEAELAAVVSRRTDGNPFFVIELARLLAAEGRLDADSAREIAVPDGVQDVLRLRLRRLPDDVRRLLCQAAVVGRRFDLDLVVEVAGVDADDALDRLDRAVEAFVVEERSPGRYRFSHALVQEALQGSMSLSRQGRVHVAVGLALERRLNDDPDLEAEVARHLVAGAQVQPDLAPRAVEHAMAAARLAEGRGALDEALVLWEQALAADQLAPSTDLRRRYDVLLGLGQARARRGAVTESRAALQEAIDIGRALDDVVRVAQAATSFRGGGIWHWREMGTFDQQLVEVLEGCMEALPAGPLQARVLSSLSMELMYQWRSAEADELGEKSVAMAREYGDRELFCDVASMRVMAANCRPGGAEQQLDLIAEVLESDPSREQELYVRFLSAPAHMQRGDVDEADRQITRCLELVRRLRHTGADVPLAWWRFFRAAERGEREAADRLAADAAALHAGSQVVARAELESYMRRVADHDLPVSDAEVEWGRAHPSPAFRALIAHPLADAGRVEEAVALLGESLPDGAYDFTSTYGECLRTEVLAAAGPSEALSRALLRIQPLADEMAIMGTTDCLGSIQYFVGRAHEASGDLEAARRAYELAVERNRKARLQYWTARAERRLAALRVTVEESDAG